MKKWIIFFTLCPLIVSFARLSAMEKENKDEDPASAQEENELCTSNAILLFKLRGRPATVQPTPSLETEFFRAVSNGDVEIMRYYLQNGGDVNIRDSGERTALAIASSKGHPHLVKFLLEEGKANPNLGGKFNFTPLMLAALGGSWLHKDIISLLLDHNANPLLCNKHGETAAQLARKYRNRCLKDKGKPDIYEEIEKIINQKIESITKKAEVLETRIAREETRRVMKEMADELRNAGFDLPKSPESSEHSSPQAEKKT